MFLSYLQGGSTVQSGRQQSYTSWQPPAPRVTSSPSWQPQSGGYTSGRTSGSGGGQRLTSSGGDGGQQQVGTPFDSGWQSQSLCDEAMSKSNTSSSSTRPSLGCERPLESAFGGGRSLEPMQGGGHQLNPPADLHSSQSQSSLTSSSSLNPPSTSSALPKSSTVTNATSPNTSTTMCTDVLINTSTSLTAAHNTLPSTQHTGFGRQDPSINTEMPLQHFDNPADPQSIPREPGSTTTGEQSHLTSRFSAGTGEVPSSVSPDKISKNTLEKDSITKFPSQSEVVAEKTFEHTLLPEPSALKTSLPGYGEQSLSNPQVRNSSSPRPSTYGGDEIFNKPIQPPQTTIMTTTTTALSQQQQVSSTITLTVVIEI